MHSVNPANAGGPDRRLMELARYAAAQLGVVDPVLEPASSDASFRRYFRIRRTHGPDVIAMDAPPAREDLDRFVAVARVLAARSLHVPEVYAADFAHGFALLEDLGDATYLMRLEAGADPEPLYAAALRALVRLQAGPPPPWPAYSRRLLDEEMLLFEHWLLERHLGIEPTQAERDLLAHARRRLADLALAQPAVAVHRDYHSRNLMAGERPPGVLDFQDAVLGPVSYDLVSLLKDCYVDWPAARVRAWLREYRGAALAAGVPVGDDEDEFVDWFETMGLQRHLKAAGIFARLCHRDAKTGYLSALPRPREPA